MSIKEEFDLKKINKRSRHLGIASKKLLLGAFLVQVWWAFYFNA